MMLGDQNTKSSARRSGWFSVFLVLACAGLSVEVVLLARKNRELQEQLDRASSQRAGTRVEPGEVVAPFLLVNEFGDKTEVTFGHGQPRSFLLFFASGCDACEPIYPIWNDLFGEMQSAHWRVLAIRVDEPGEASSGAEAKLRLPAYSLADGAQNVLQKVSTVPTTLMLDERGLVERAWTGLLSSLVVDDLRSTLASAPSP